MILGSANNQVLNSCELLELQRKMTLSALRGDLSEDNFSCVCRLPNTGKGR